jgi:hypothetical protein
MFPWHALAEGLNPNRHAHATAKGTAVKEAKCEQCECEYTYLVFRRAIGKSTAFLVADHETAQARANDDLYELLKSACDPVPCPNCGWYQRDMVARARQLRFGWLSIPSRVFFVISCILLPFVALFAAVWLEEKDRYAELGLTTMERQDAETLLVSLLLWGAALILAAVLLILRFLLPRFYDPNAADPKRRIDLGRYRAVTKEALRTGAFPRDANPDTRDGNPRRRYLF